jgi:3-oxoacyl-[acyl-carrier-protein] synthase-3
MINVQAIAAYLPGSPIPSQDLAQRLGWPSGWIEANSGVHTRHFASEADSNASMGAKALQRALDQAELGPSALDLLIFASASCDHLIPHTACLVKQALGWEAYDLPCFDLDATCLSYLSALEVAASLLESGRYRRIAVVNSEIASRSLNPDDRKTYSLFGDAAVATILGVAADGRPTPAYFVTHAAGARYAIIPAGGNAMRLTHPHNPAEAYFFQMQGRHLIKLTFAHVDAFVAQIEARFGRALQDYDRVVVHQASLLGVELFIKRFGLDRSKVHLNLPRYGNCISASIPLGLWDLLSAGAVQPGEHIILMGTAAGLSIGAVALDL